MLTNQFREQEKLTRVEVNPQLQKTAQYFADYMARTHRYGHQADGSTPDERTKKFGYDYCIVAENIAYEYNSAGFTTAELASEFFEGWKASPGHRKNMLDPDVIETGLAIAQGVDSGYFFAVQVFGRPKSKAVEFTITNAAPIAVEYKMGDRTFTLEPRHIRTHQVRAGCATWRFSGPTAREKVEPYGRTTATISLSHRKARNCSSARKD